ncbi:kinase-like domain-containing protein [Pyrenochaeta sp. MPI-SDFR-AT-0127]|nr:kinase-like domain-containing protein [Pyrenochaeta sp. MPI-SDFR-AT-0127]
MRQGNSGRSDDDSEISTVGVKDYACDCEEGPVRVLLYPLSDAAELTTRRQKQNSTNADDTELTLHLSQCKCTERFTLGSTPQNHVILRSPDVTSQQEEERESSVYINSLHASIYLDPGSGDAELLNATIFSTFKVWSADNDHIHLVAPGKSFHLRADRSWGIQVSDIHTFGLLLPPSCDQYHALVPKSTFTESKTMNLVIAPEKHVGKPQSPTQCSKRFVRVITLPRLPTPPPEPVFTNLQTTVTKERRNGRLVAVKSPSKGYLVSSAISWRHEVEIMKHLKHENVANLVAFDARKHKLVFDWVGPDLSKFQDPDTSYCTLDTPLQQLIWTDIAKALKYLQDENTVHFDIKPENILLADDRSKAVLCDFGLSRPTKAGIHYGGTPRYVAPELLTQEERGFPADIWAFGVTMLYVLQIIPLPTQNGWLIAKLPVDGKTRQRMREWLEEIRDTVDHISDRWPVLSRMLSSNSRRRITAQALESEVAHQQFAPLEN